MKIRSKCSAGYDRDRMGQHPSRRTVLNNYSNWVKISSRISCQVSVYREYKLNI